MERLPNQQYTKEFKEEAVKMALSENITHVEAARRIGIPKETLYGWIKKYKATGTVPGNGKPCVASDLEAENARLRRELAEAKMERDILKKANGVLRKRVAERYAFIKKMRLQYPIKIMRRVLKVSRSGYYAWLNRQPSKREIENNRLEIAIKAEHYEHKERYGPERLKPELEEKGFKAGICRIRRIRKKLGLRCKQKKKYKATTDSKHDLPVYPNILGQDFSASGPNEKWVTDITYIPTEEGWLYLAGIVDVFHAGVVGYEFSSRMKKSIVINAMNKAVTAKHPPEELIMHSDRGSQYCSRYYRRLLRRYGMLGSMSRKGNCYDNALMESFWGILKSELIYGMKFRTRAEAISVITEYIELDYNRRRRHSRLGNISPAAFLQEYYRNLAVAA
ncbi:IS3 family transposase [Elusimicrobiota bacterium]